MTSRPIIVLGAGGHGKISVSALKALDCAIIGVAERDERRHGQEVLGVPVIGGDDLVMAYATDEIELVNGVGSTQSTGDRRAVFERFRDAGYAFRTMIHPSAIVGEGTKIGEGTHVMAGAVIQPDCRIGVDTIVNTGAVVDHDCVIGDHVHIAPGAVLGGYVRIGDGTHLGAGATVIQGRAVGDGALVAAGAVVISDVAAGARVAGMPARDI